MHGHGFRGAHAGRIDNPERAVIDRLEMHFRGRGLERNMQSGKIPGRIGDDGLRKIIDQLMNNAIKFTQRGFIELACEYSEDKHWVLISVTDTGRGVTEDQREKIFTPFHKADSFQQGIGLGLSISKKIAQRLGGDLMLDTDYTEGARFVLKIPANTQQDI